MRRYAQVTGPLADRPYSAAVRDGDIVYVSGQLGQGADGSIVEGGIGPETEAALENVKRLLGEMGASLSDVVKTLVFLVDWDDYDGYNDVYRRYFPASYPARSTVGTTALALGGRVEIEAFALVRG